MENFPDLFQSTLILLKLGIIIGMLVYIGFAVVVYKQVLLMSQTLNVEFDRQLKVIAGVHLVVAIFIFGFALIV